MLQWENGTVAYYLSLSSDINDLLSVFLLAKGELEGIVVGVCFAFLLCVLVVLILWFNFKSWWVQILSNSLT